LSGTDLLKYCRQRRELINTLIDGGYFVDISLFTPGGGKLILAEDTAGHLAGGVEDEQILVADSHIHSIPQVARGFR